MFCLFLLPTPCHVHKRSPPRFIKLHGLEAKLAFAHALALLAPGAAVAWVKAVRIDDADDDDDNDDNDDDDEDDEEIYFNQGACCETVLVVRIRMAREVAG